MHFPVGRRGSDPANSAVPDGPSTLYCTHTSEILFRYLNVIKPAREAIAAKEREDLLAEGKALS
jgi:hypothetical protein